MDAERVHERCNEVLNEVENAVVADTEILRTILTGFQARGHVLLEDVPGTGKTLTARSFANALGLSYSRIQFTPDLLPADVTGTHTFNEKTREFDFQRGPVFSNILLADEINRASPKTQAALLEAMEERQVTVNGETHPLPNPFFVIATQNPVEQEGVFPLPEAQKDRFAVKTSLGFPDEEGELSIIDARADRTNRTPETNTVCDPETVVDIRQAPESVHVDDELRRYLVRLSRRTRTDNRVKGGVSPRGTQRLFETVRALASTEGRTYVVPEDVKRMAVPVLSHRLVLTADARVNDVEKADVIADLLDEVEVPTINSPARRPA